MKREIIRVGDRVTVNQKPLLSHAAPPIKIGSNVHVTLRRRPGGRVVEERRSHNIFLDYGREWLSLLVGYDTGYVPFRDDRLRYMAFGIGGTQQVTDSAVLRGTWKGFPNKWDYEDPDDLSTGGYGLWTDPGTGNPTYTDTDPLVTGLEYPIQITDQNYYDNLTAPASFPEAGTIRVTAVLGYNEVSFGSATAVPLSEVGLFTAGVPFSYYPPLDDGIEVDPPSPPVPPIGTRYMVAYNTFPSLTKTSSFVLQVDWELRFA